MPLTASKTDADTRRATRLATRGFVPPAITELFIMPIHSSTGSGEAADIGTGLVASTTASSISMALWIVAPAGRRPSNRREPKLDLYMLRIMCPPEGRRQRCYWLADGL